ncbi:MAG TPA: type II toxin-antitoxin system VapC family toxin [Candidatus Hydrogenedentes bacterium]|nr:type II toxin-antitoxin system VapC family toxin [Candidatus Hydrogenedentota bacterium]HIJ74721.1 type II toxin-antitoxin system VapC family toxin [Candidatus Hydrogenedentota bacterium]
MALLQNAVNSKAEKPRVYLETSVVSYLTARASRDLVVAAHQQITQEWWERERTHYVLFVSDLVHVEAGQGNPDAAQRRLALLEPLAVLEESEEIRELAELYAKEIPLPRRAAADALHMALAAWHEMDYLLTWTCQHIANGFVRRRLEEIDRTAAITSPTICTPEELLYGNQNMD